MTIYPFFVFDSKTDHDDKISPLCVTNAAKRNIALTVCNNNEFAWHPVTEFRCPDETEVAYNILLFLSLVSLFHYY